MPEVPPALRSSRDDYSRELLLNLGRRLGLCLPALLLGSTLAAAQSFSMSGRVVDARTGQAVARSVVELNPVSQRSSSVSMTTDEEGRFSFSNLAAGKYQLSASRRGYLTQSYQQHEQFSTAIAVGPDLLVDNLLFPLTPQSVVFGTITDEAGEPVRKARVHTYSIGGSSGQGADRVPRAGQSAMTDDLGKFELADLQPGDYYLAVTAQPWYAQAGRINVPEPADGDPSPDSTRNVAYPTTFYPNAIDPDEATPIPLRGGEHLEIDITLNAQHAMRLHIPIAANPDVSYNVTLTQSLFGSSAAVSTGMQFRRENEIVIDGVLPGHYDVEMTQFGAVPNKATRFSADVAAGSTSLNATEMISEVTVTGKVAGIEGVDANPGISLFSSHPLRNYYAQLDASGSFSVKVEPGNYEVTGHIPRMYLAQIASANTAIRGRILEVKSGAAPKLEIIAARGFGQIDGYVTAGNHKPGGIMVLLAPEHAIGNRVLFRRDQSDSDGSFTLPNVIPGKYRLYAIEQGFDLDWTEPQVLRALEKESVPVQVHEGEKLQETVEVQAKP